MELDPDRVECEGRVKKKEEYFHRNTINNSAKDDSTALDRLSSAGVWDLPFFQVSKEAHPTTKLQVVPKEGQNQ